MFLAALLLPVALVAIVLLVQRLKVPAYLALMVTVVAYGIAAHMTWQSIGRAFGQGFVAALEQAGLPVVAGSLAGTLLIGQPLTRIGAAVAGVLAGLGGSATAGLALLQPAGRARALALTILAVQALVVPSPLAVASAFVVKADLATMMAISAPIAVVILAAIWLIAGRDEALGRLSWGWLAIALPLALLIVSAVSQIPSEPLGKGGAREFYTGIAKPLPLAVLAILLAVVLSRRWQPKALGDTRWAQLLLTVGAAGGFARVLDETGMADLLAEQALNPSLGTHLGLLAPFLAAAIVKTMQGNSLSAVLTASGMVEPLLPAFGLDSATGRALAAAATGAGAIAICHVNDPFFWIAADMAKLPPGRALGLISLGSLLVAIAAVGLLLLAARLLA